MTTPITEITITFLCGLRGYHVYMASWTPILGDRMPAIHESGNAHDLYAIAAKGQKVSGPRVLQHGYNDMAI